MKVTWRDIQSLVPPPGRSLDHKLWLDAFPVLREAAKTPQSDIYHAEGDTWTHICMVLDELVARPAYQALSRHDQEVTCAAAGLHDVAKYRTTTVDPATGHIGHPQHSSKGALDARQLLFDAGAPFHTREAICRLINVHQQPFFAINGSRGKSPEFIVRELSWRVRLPLLALLAEADMRGRICKDPRIQQEGLDNIALFEELAREDGCWDGPRAFFNDHTRVHYFRGANVHPDYELPRQPGPHSLVTLLSGPPAAGKNKLVSERWPDEPVMSYDDTRSEMGLKYGENEGGVTHRVRDKARELLRAGRPFVWNATHLSRDMRGNNLQLCFDYDATVQIVYVEQPKEVLLARNSKRDTSLSNKDLLAMLPKMDPPLPSEAHQVEYVV